MDIDRKLELGELYKELRLARGLKLKDIARQNLTISQLSKFEQGQSMLSADRLLLAISGLNMNFSEFAMAMNNFRLDEFTLQSYKRVKLRDQNDLAGLTELLPAKTESDSLKLPMYQFIEYALIKNTIATIDNETKLTAKEINRLTEYFYGIESWTSYEVYVFGSTTMIYETQDLIFLANYFWKASQKILQLPTYRNMVKSALINVSGTLIRYNEDYHARFFMDKLAGLLFPQELAEQAVLKFLLATLAYKDSNFQDRTGVDEVVAAMKILGSESFAQQLLEQLEQIEEELNK